jgi:hypothetical protein
MSQVGFLNSVPAKAITEKAIINIPSPEPPEK